MPYLCSAYKIKFYSYMKRQGSNTRLLHTPLSKKDPRGALRMPIYENVAFEYDTAEEIAAVFQGRQEGSLYSRINNPTCDYLEQVIRQSEDALHVISTSSGMAAITTLFLGILQSGDNIVTTTRLFANTITFFETILQPFGVEIRYADLTFPQEVETLVDENTRAIFCETISNPALQVVDVHALAQIAKEHKTLMVVDTTITPLSMFNAKAYGVDVAVFSSTKYLSGGGTALGGLIVDYGSYDWLANPKLKPLAEEHGELALTAKLRQEAAKVLGAALSPHSAYLHTIGLETFGMRVEKSCQNSLILAQWLQKQPAIRSIYYPGLEDSPFYEIACKQFGNHFGAIVSFEMKTEADCFTFINRLKLIRRATNLNDNKSLIIHPASTIYSEFPEEKREELGVTAKLIRLAVGIEDVEDLIADMRQAL